MPCISVAFDDSFHEMYDCQGCSPNLLPGSLDDEWVTEVPDTNA